MINNIIAVFLGGGLGSLIRYLVSQLTKNIFMMPIIGTFFVNIAGCFLIGYIYALNLYKEQSEPTKLFITVGLLGGLTTFSTFNLEIFELIKAGKIEYAILYMLASLTIGLLFTYLGFLMYTKF
jgi:CrcB protein